MRTADYTTGKWLELGLGLRLRSELVLWFGLGFCQHPHAYFLHNVRLSFANPSPHFTSGQWLNGTIKPVNSYVYTLSNTTSLTKSAALTDGSSSLWSFVNVLYMHLSNLNRYFLYETVLSNIIQQLGDHAPSVCLWSAMADRKCTYALAVAWNGPCIGGYARRGLRGQNDLNSKTTLNYRNYCCHICNNRYWNCYMSEWKYALVRTTNDYIKLL